jgi:RNA polymerase sigma-70 factor (ECF subfamily)
VNEGTIDMSPSIGSAPQPADDPASLGRRLATDPGALRDCYAELSPMVLAYLRRLVPRDEAEDVLQQVFLDVWRSRDRFDPARPLEPWVLNIAHRRAVDHLRRQSRSPSDPAAELPGEIVDGDRDTSRFAERFADAVLVRDALEVLPVEQRETLVLAYYGDYTQSQIAGRLGVPLGTVKARSSRGLRHLASVLVPEEGQ